MNLEKKRNILLKKIVEFVKFLQNFAQFKYFHFSSLAKYFVGFLLYVVKTILQY